MQLGMIGLGRMGMNMAHRLIAAGHEVVAYNRTREKTAQLAAAGGRAAWSLEHLAAQLAPPRIVWLMLPAGGTVDEHIDSCVQYLCPGDIIIDGGNSFYKDDIARADRLAPKGIHYLDAGVSGGLWGLEFGYCIMVGGDERVFKHIEPILGALCAPEGYLYCGPTGAGHFVKMVHNGIEYAMMEAYGEGFNIMRSSRYGEQLAFEKIAKLWNRGSVVRSWLLELLEKVFQDISRLDEIEPYLEDSGEGRWTLQQAVELGVPAPVIAASLFQRFESRGNGAFSHKVLAALRNRFGGHQVKKSGMKGMP
ncbi:MAG: decarboxylating 6-phosphogluconate dehydrogenase [Desulfobacterota bacterium]|nr:decarboxylating 6-phosphogluconate dehydrogenase [Thermodesulfobacteriota bacterium]